MYKACIFDLDGTLTDTLESIAYSVNETLKELGFNTITNDQCRIFVGNGVKNLLEQALKAVGDEKLTRLEEALIIHKRVYKECCTYRVEPYDGIIEMLQGLKSQEIKLAVLSNKPHMQTVKVVETYFGKELFSRVQGQQEGIPRKPDPAGVFLTMEEFGIRPEECLYVGDSEVDMRTGKSAGMTTVGVTWGFRTKEVLIQNGANHTIDRAEELITIVKEKRR